MRILLTGASSFTGYWFAHELVAAGHAVTATFRATEGSYAGTRAERVRGLSGKVDPVWECVFGSPRFMTLIESRDWDLLCHHAAEMTNYRSWDFDPFAAAQSNVRNMRAVISALAGRRCRALLMTGSFFEPYEGLGDPEMRAFSPYGLSKHFSFEATRIEAEAKGLRLGKFVIPNPFGPLEEQRFTTYLAREWFAGRVPTVQTPTYVRDNIHVDLLARAYRRFCESIANNAGCDTVRCAPSGYIESQGAFALRVAREVGQRLHRIFDVAMADQRLFAEPPIRLNTTPARIAEPDWSESAAWDSCVSYYMRLYPLAF